MSTPIVTIEGLGKQYKIGRTVKKRRGLAASVGEVLLAPYRRLKYLREKTHGSETFWALKDINLDIAPGEVVGVIGRNGAGKSTLLKILSRVTDPTEGRAVLHGRVGSLLEVGTGFHDELTGRENVYLSGAILGMKKAEITRKFDEIVDFSGVEQFLDTPVKRYSSGMRVRLGFAVAAHLEPEILIIDEVLAVGDSAFQQKCLGRMSDVAESGRTILFVSHNMGAIQTLCPRAILLRQGELVDDGPTDAVVGEYLRWLSEGVASAFVDNPERTGNGQIRYTAARILDGDGRETDNLVSGMPATIVLDYENLRQVRWAHAYMTIYNHLGAAVTQMDMQSSGGGRRDPGPSGVFKCHIPRLPLPIGRYRVAIGLGGETGPCDILPNALAFSVVSSKFFEGGKTPPPQYCGCMVEHEWIHEVSL